MKLVVEFGNLNFVLHDKALHEIRHQFPFNLVRSISYYVFSLSILYDIMLYYSIQNIVYFLTKILKYGNLADLSYYCFVIRIILCFIIRFNR